MSEQRSRRSISEYKKQIVDLAGLLDKFSKQNKKHKKRIAKLEESNSKYVYQLNQYKTQLSKLHSQIQTSFNRSIFDNNNNNNITLITPHALLSELLRSKQEILQSKRKLQSLTIRYSSEKKKMRQLRHFISRMQTEFKDLKTMTKMHKPKETPTPGFVNDDTNDDIDPQLTLLETDKDDDFIEHALSLIMSETEDINDEYAQASSQALHNNKVKKRYTYPSRNNRIPSNYTRRSMASSPESSVSALGMYHFNKKSITPQSVIVTDNNDDLIKDMSHQMSKSMGNIDDLMFDELVQEQIIQEKRNSFVNISVRFDDDELIWEGYDIEWIENWKTTHVINWLKTIYNGDMKKYIYCFKNAKINGKKLLDLTTVDLFDIGVFVRKDADRILKYIDSIHNRKLSSLSDDIDCKDAFDDDIDDHSSDNMGRLIGELNAIELINARKLTYLDASSVNIVNFNGIRQYYKKQNHILLANLFCLVCDEVGLLDVNIWNDLIRTVKEAKTDEQQINTKQNGSLNVFDDHLVIVREFVDIKSLYSLYSDPQTGALSLYGAKYFVSLMRYSGMIVEHDKPEDLRDDQDAVVFFIGLDIFEFKQFIMRLPNRIWDFISNQLDIEYVYRQIRRNIGNVNVTPKVLKEAIVEIAGGNVTIVEIGGGNVCNKDDSIINSIKEMGLIGNSTVNVDIWIKKIVWIERYSNSGLSRDACHSVFNALVVLNDQIEKEIIAKTKKTIVNIDNAKSDSKKVPIYTQIKKPIYSIT